jgi:hypothetical protein
MDGLFEKDAKMQIFEFLGVSETGTCGHPFSFCLPCDRALLVTFFTENERPSFQLPDL